MLLALDVGNTTLSVGLVVNGEIRSPRRAATRPTATPDELEMVLDGLLGLDGRRLGEVTGIVLASVVPAMTAALVSLTERRAIRLVLADASSVPMAVRTERPAEVGADRLVNALAAARLHGTPAIVVDFGTATNFDVVAADGAYVGGALAPGLELGLEALAERTARLPRIQLARPERAIGRDTVSAMQSGAIIGYIGLVRELVRSIREELTVDGGDRPVVILTGGLSSAPWATEIPDVDVIDPLLTLRGLAILHAETMTEAET